MKETATRKKLRKKRPLGESLFNAVPFIPAPAAVTAAVGAFLVIRLAATLARVGNAAWGLGYAGYLPWEWDVLLALTLPFVFLVPRISQATASIVFRATQRVTRIGAVTTTAIVASVVAAFLVTRVRVASALLGDGSYFLTEVYRLLYDPAHQTPITKPTSFLTGHLIRWLELSFRFDELAMPFIVVGALAAALLVFGLFHLLRTERPAVALLLASLVLGGGGTLFFFGYVELYAMQYVAVCWYLLAAWRALRRGGSLRVPAVALAAAVLFGVASLLLLPSFLVLLALREPRIAARVAPRALARGLAVAQVLLLAGVYALIGVSSPGGSAMSADYLLPLAPRIVASADGLREGIHRYTVFSAMHLRDVPNAWVLAGGCALLLLPGAWIARRKEQTDPLVLFLGAAALSGLLVTFCGHSVFGLARDWDLTAMPVLPAVFLAAALLAGIGERRAFLPAFLPLLLAVCSSTAYLWVRVNADGDAAARRMSDLLDGYTAVLPGVSTYTGLENLVKYHGTLKHTDKTMDLLRRMLATGWDRMTTYRKLVAQVSANPRIRDREFPGLLDSLLSDLRARRPLGHPLYVPQPLLREYAATMLITAAYRGRGDLARAYRPAYREAIGAWREGALVDLVLDSGDAPAAKLARARPAVDAACREPALLFTIGDIAMDAEALDEAATYYERAIAAEPHEYPILYLIVAGIHERQGRIPRAMDALQRCMANCRLARERNDALAWLERLQKEQAGGKK
jgi:hypothetical protein